MNDREQPAKSHGRRTIRCWSFVLCSFSLAFLLGPATPSNGQGNEKNQPSQAKQPQGTGDIELVEKLLAARYQYQRSLERLRLYYISANDVERSRWAEDELKQYHRVAKQAYRLDLDVPPPTLQPAQNIPAANKIYQRAMEYKDKGWGTDYTDNQRRAELLLQQILSQYPQCNKIGKVAYQLGDLYEGKAYRQYRRSAQYFERCFQWNQHTDTDARLRAARLYDRYILDRGKAIELYRGVTQHETDPKRIAEAEKRLAELSGSR